MAQVAALVDPGMQALLTGDVPQLASLMRLNFRLRRQLFGDAALNTSLKLVQVGCLLWRHVAECSPAAACS